MSKNEKQKPKVVKIDEHIRKSKNSVQETVRRGRGRPRKDAGSNEAGGFNSSSPSKPLDDRVSLPVKPVAPTIPSETIKPQYDTTEEAKGLISAPFEVVAGLTGNPKYKLYPAQLEAIAPSFKVVYDKRLAPKMGENADLIAFGMVFVGVLFEKVSVAREDMAKAKEKQSYHVEEVKKYDSVTPGAINSMEERKTSPFGAQAFPGIPTELVK